MTEADFDEPPGPLVWLQAWYAANCDGDWEHGYGVSIETIDNPGWRLTINLEGTALAGQSHEWRQLERGGHDWLHWRVADDTFEAACGPLNLGEALSTFRFLGQGHKA